MGQIFLSYAREDGHTARRIEGALEDLGWSVFWDTEIRAGASWDEVLQLRLERAECVVCLWSRKSVVSPWVREEAAVGRERGILVPCLIEEVEQAEIPLGFRRVQTARLVDWDGSLASPSFQHLVDSITHLIGEPKPRKRKHRAGRAIVRQREEAMTVVDNLKARHKPGEEYVPSAKEYEELSRIMRGLHDITMEIIRKTR